MEKKKICLSLQSQTSEMMFREQVLNKNAENLCKASAENLFYAEPPPNLAQNLKNFAEIAQLVEHDLAKVGVASSSLVFRSREVIRNGGVAPLW